MYCQNVVRDRRRSKTGIDLNLTRTDEITIEFRFQPLGTSVRVLFLCMGGVQGFVFTPVIDVSGGRVHMCRVCVLYGFGASLGSYHFGFTVQ